MGQAYTAQPPHLQHFVLMYEGSEIPAPEEAGIPRVL